MLLAGLAALNLVVSNPNIVNSYIERIVLLAGIYVILAVSLNLVNGFTGQFSIGHAGFYGIGAYVGAAITVYGQRSIFANWFTSSDSPISPLLGRSVPSVALLLHGSAALVIAMVLGGVAAAVAGLIVGLPSLKLRGDYLAIVTLGFNQIIVVLLYNMNAVGGSKGFGGLYTATGFYPIPTLSSFFWVYLVATVLVILSLNLRKSVHGLAFLSIREDEVAAEAMGVPTTKYKVYAFVLGAFFAGVAGALNAHTDGYIKPDSFNFIISINIVIMVVLGGMGSVTGTAIGAVLLTVLPQYLYVSDEYRLAIYALLLILLMLLRPQGIFGHEEFGREWIKAQAAGVRTLPSRAKIWIRELPQRLERGGDDEVSA